MKKSLDPYIQTLIAGVRRRDPKSVGQMVELVGVLVNEHVAGRLSAADRDRLSDRAMVKVTNSAMRLKKPPPDGEAWVLDRIESLADSHAAFVAEDRDRAADVFDRLMPARGVAAHGLDLAVKSRSFDIVGGDFFDHSVTDSDALIALGDVAGKGMASAEWAAYMVAQFRSLSHRMRDPHALTRRLDKLLHAASGPAEYAVVSISRWRPAKRVLTIANAGFPRPHLIRRGSVRELGGDGNPIGLMPDAKFSVVAEHPESGDVILMASDGISEQPNNQGRSFDVGRLARQLDFDPNETAEAIAEQAWQLFESGTRRFVRKDDQTLAVLRFSFGV